MPDKSGLPAGVRGSAAPWPATRLAPASSTPTATKPSNAVTRVPTLVPPKVGRTLFAGGTRVNKVARLLSKLVKRSAFSRNGGRAHAPRGPYPRAETAARAGVGR